VLVDARKYAIRDKKLEVYARLAANESLVLSNSTDKETNMLLLADSVLKAQGSNKSEAQIMADLNMLRLASHAYGLGSGTYIPEEKAKGFLG